MSSVSKVEILNNAIIDVLEENREYVDNYDISEKINAYLEENPETEFLNIKKKGAKGDGETDDSECFEEGVPGYVVNDGIYCVDAITMARLNANNCIGNGSLRLYGAPHNYVAKEGYYSPLDYTIEVSDLNNPLKKILASGSEAEYYMDRPYCTRGLKPLEGACNIHTIGAIYKIKDAELPETFTLCLGKMALFALQKDGIWRKLAEDKYPSGYGLFELPWTPETTKPLSEDKVVKYKDHIEYKLTPDDFTGISDGKIEACLHFWGTDGYIEDSTDIIGIVSAFDFWVKEEEAQDKIIATIGVDQIDTATNIIKQGFAGIAMNVKNYLRTQWGTTFNGEEMDIYCDFNYMQWLYNYETVSISKKYNRLSTTEKYDDTFIAMKKNGDLYYKLFDDIETYRGLQLINPIKHMLLPYYNPTAGSTGAYCKLFAIPIVDNSTNRYVFRIDYTNQTADRQTSNLSALLTIIRGGSAELSVTSAHNVTSAGIITVVINATTIDVYAKGVPWCYIAIDIELIAYTNFDLVGTIAYDNDLLRVGAGSSSIMCDKWTTVDTTDCTVVESVKATTLEDRIVDLENKIAELATTTEK